MTRFRITYEEHNGIVTGVFSPLSARLIINHHRLGLVRITSIRRSKEQLHVAGVRFSRKGGT